MNIELHKITVRELVAGYVNSEDEGVVAYGGRLDVRPKYQRAPQNSDSGKIQIRFRHMNSEKQRGKWYNLRVLNMKGILISSFLSCLALSALAAARVVVPSLPEATRHCAETETNVAFSAGAPRDNVWRLSIELDASVSNCVEVVLGSDADEDGILGIDEGALSVGWSCGEWFWRDRRGGGAGRVADMEGSRRLDWTMRLASSDKSARSVDGNAFSGAVAPTCFSADWDMIRVVSRGAESLCVESRMSVDALKLRIR